MLEFFRFAVSGGFWRFAGVATLLGMLLSALVQVILAFLGARTELASQSADPAEHGYAAKRRALYAYVRELERLAAVRPAPTEEAND